MQAAGGPGLRVAIIGAGLAGLTAARRLQQEGLSPVVFDKSRGLGGRLATRRAENGLQFDHGAQYLSPKSEGFAAFLQEAVAAGAAAEWPREGDAPRFVGLPGMSGLARWLGRGIDVRHGEEVGIITPNGGLWQVQGALFDRVICTTPAPQAARLIGEGHPLFAALSAVEMVPNLTLMVAFSEDPPVSFDTRLSDGPIAWLARDGAKPGRVVSSCWVAQASLDWSKAHLELDKEELAARMLPMVCEMLAVSPTQAHYVAAHRWRYAQVDKPLGQPFLSDGAGLFLGGDWALSARAEGAWQSGFAIAEAVLAGA